MWWRFAARADAPRVLRVIVAALAGHVAFGMLRLFRHASVEPAPPTADDVVRDELAWQFKSVADRHGGWPVFYEVPAASLPHYIDIGLSFLKLGEEARVDLPAFSLEGG